MRDREKKERKKRSIVIKILVLSVIVAIGMIILLLNYMGANDPGWHDKGGIHSYYVMENGERAKGYNLIDGKAYLFDDNGDIVTEKGWYDEHGRMGAADSRFYCTGNSELATGWKYIDGKVRYFYQKSDTKGEKKLSELARDYTTEGDIYIPSKGYIDGDEGLVLAYGMDVLNRYGWNLEAAYRYSASLRFVPGSDEHYGMTVRSCALHGFKYGKGNCLAWAGTFCVMAKLLGKDCRLIWGTLPWRGTRPHAWTEIWDTKDATDEEVHVCDPRKNDGKDMAGFYVHYGEKGTRKYNLDSRQYVEW